MICWRRFFSWIWDNFGTQNGPKIDLRRCKADPQQSLFYYSKTYVFEVRALQKLKFLPLETHARNGSDKITDFL